MAADYRRCPRCRGTGWGDEWDQIECDECYGDGELPVLLSAVQERHPGEETGLVWDDESD